MTNLLQLATDNSKKVDEELVNLLSHMLEKAKNGHLLGMTASGITCNGEIVGFHAINNLKNYPNWLYAMVGHLQYREKCLIDFLQTAYHRHEYEEREE